MIHIGMNPDLISTSNFVLTWHGLWTFIAVAIGVYLVGRWAPRYNIDPDTVYSAAIWCIVGGVIGCRLVHVIDLWAFYSQNPWQIFAIWNGGIGIWGVPIGGFVAGALYARYAKISLGPLADLAAPGVILAMTIGRIGDIINGEHVGTLTTKPWGFVYTHPSSLSFQLYGDLTSHSPIAYEMIWNIIAFSVLWWLLKDRIRPHGMLYVAFVALYAFGRFFTSFYRATDTDRLWAIGLNEGQIICLLALAITVPLLAYRGYFVSRDEKKSGEPLAPKKKARA